MVLWVRLGDVGKEFISDHTVLVSSFLRCAFACTSGKTKSRSSSSE